MLYVLIVAMYSFLCHGQMSSIEKATIGNRSRLLIDIRTNDGIKKYIANCGFKKVTMLADSTKIRLLGELLSFTSDTAMCYKPIGNYANLTIARKVPVSEEYSLKIDAIILINYVAFASNAFVYSPYPVLYDEETGKETCCNGTALDSVVDLYKNWYKSIQKNGFTDYSFPLLGQRYEWFGCFGCKSKKSLFKQYPHWNDYYNCKELE